MIENPVDKRKLGQETEELAEKFLQHKGYKIIKRNYKTSLGEVDIIAEDIRSGGVLVFVEVRSRSYTTFGEPQVSINLAKRRQISKAALCYLNEHKSFDRSCRFDVIAISLHQERKPKIEHIENAFELEKRYTY